MALVRSLTFSLWKLLSNTFVKNIQLILSNHLSVLISLDKLFVIDVNLENVEFFMVNNFYFSDRYI